MLTLSTSGSVFEKNPRRLQEVRCRPLADAIYKRVFGDLITIKRHEREDAYLLDKEFAMDVTITLPIGLVLTGQEKFLSQKYAKYRSVTIEHMQNPATNEKGDWFKMAVQFYFVGYESADGKTFSPWIMLNWPSIVNATAKGAIHWIDNRNKDGHARASFRYCVMDKIPESCVIAKDVGAE